jgi:hypothetical protein
MKTLICSVVLALLAATAAHSKELPDAPTPKVEVEAAPISQFHGVPKPPAANFDRRTFALGVGLLAASQAADVITTRRCLDVWTCRELDPLFGSRYPSPGRQAGLNVVFFVGRAGLFYLTERSTNKYVRWTGRTFMGSQIAMHTVCAYQNAGR